MPNRRQFLVLALAACSLSLADDAPQSYSAASAVWQQHRGTAEYQTYATEFTQFNNHFHLDEKDGCYALAPGPVSLLLVITHNGAGEFAIIERVLTDVDNAKARCFERSYRGVPTKVPPFLPFVIQMTMR